MLRAKVLGFIGWLLITLWSITVRLRFVNRHTPAGLKAAGKNVIYAFWHGRRVAPVLQPSEQGRHHPGERKRDGDIQAVVLRRFGFEVVRGVEQAEGVAGRSWGWSMAYAGERTLPSPWTGRGARSARSNRKRHVSGGKAGQAHHPVATGAKRRWILERYGTNTCSRYRSRMVWWSMAGPSLSKRHLGGGVGSKTKRTPEQP